MESKVYNQCLWYSSVRDRTANDEISVHSERNDLVPFAQKTDNGTAAVAAENAFGAALLSIGVADKLLFSFLNGVTVNWIYIIMEVTKKISMKITSRSGEVKHLSCLRTIW